MTSPTLDAKKLEACIHCGLCLEACPTYIETGEEMSSPRGRLYLMKAYQEGSIKSSDLSFYEHELSCLVCRSCETACPSGVEFGYLMEQTRAIIRKDYPIIIHKLLFTHVIGSNIPAKIAQLVTSTLSKLKIKEALAAFFDLAGFLRLASSVELIPDSDSSPVYRPTIYPARSEKIGDVGILIGCIGDVFTAKINDATINVLTQLGYDVHTLREITCCGSLAIHEGYHDHAISLAKKNTEVILSSNVDYFITNIAGCGANMKNYPQQLGTEGSGALRKKIYDISEFLMKYHANDLATMLHHGNHPQKIAYHAPCHLVHGQRIISEPLELLRLVTDIEVMPLEENDICCGSAGVYNIKHPEMANALLLRKKNIIENAHPDIVATANAGCQMQLQKGYPNIPVRHVIEILADALRGSAITKTQHPLVK